MSTDGEWSGKTLSTPSPYEIFRTVNVSRTPDPLRAMTMPSKDCILAFPSSMILTCTSTVSPILNSGTSFFRFFASISFMNFSMSPSFSFLLFTHYSLLFTVFQQIRPSLGRPAQCLCLPPCLYLFMVPAHYDIRDLHAHEFSRPRILRILQKAVLERLAAR